MKFVWAFLRHATVRALTWRRHTAATLSTLVGDPVAAPVLVPALACECAYDSAEPTGSPSEGPNLYAKAEELVVRRGREIYTQGSMGSDSDWPSPEFLHESVSFRTVAPG